MGRGDPPLGRQRDNDRKDLEDNVSARMLVGILVFDGSAGLYFVRRL
jgi:hypothetical protein